mgnify:CR=1 FL=1|tara:strand:- start:4454 stop:5539 length:1086 start_codon:yes stop_codon:yes gene_type:complete
MTRVNSTGKESSSNFSPDNGTGLAVRTAIKDILESLRTVNSAAGDPSGAANLAAYQLHIDSDTDTLKIRNGANSAFVTLGNVSQTNFGFLSASGGTLTGVLGVSAGSSSAPALHFGDTNTGLFKKSTNQIGIATAAIEQLFLDQNGITLNAQNEVRFGDSDSSNYVGIKAPSTVSSNKTITLPDETGTLLTSASSIANSNLANSSVTVGSTAISLGASATTIAGLTTLTSTNFQATNIKDTSGNNSSTPEEIAQGRAKAWINFNGTGTAAINDDFNISTITDNGTGDFTIRFSNAFSTTNYAVVACNGRQIQSNSTNAFTILVDEVNTAKETGLFRIISLGTNTYFNVVDPNSANIAVFGD